MRKTYEIPSVELTQFVARTTILVDSPTGPSFNDEPVPSGGGGD